MLLLSLLLLLLLLYYYCWVIVIEKVPRLSIHSAENLRDRLLLLSNDSELLLLLDNAFSRYDNLGNQIVIVVESNNIGSVVVIEDLKQQQQAIKSEIYNFYNETKFNINNNNNNNKNNYQTKTTPTIITATTTTDYW